MSQLSRINAKDTLWQWFTLLARRKKLGAIEKVKFAWQYLEGDGLFERYFNFRIQLLGKVTCYTSPRHLKSGLNYTKIVSFNRKRGCWNKFNSFHFFFKYTEGDMNIKDGGTGQNDHEGRDMGGATGRKNDIIHWRSVKHKHDHFFINIFYRFHSIWA